MNRRNFFKNGSLAAISLATLSIVSCNTSQNPQNEQKKQPNSIDINELTINELQDLVKNGKLTYSKLTQMYLDRIKDLDKSGPALNAIIELNPDALAIAATMDNELKAGKWRVPMHGIPVLIKDNIDTGDKMLTTAGSLALLDNKATVDATIVQKLREAGAVILGKTNLSEWANFRSTRSSSGWSSRGGQTKNPYLLDRSPCGSSSGSGVAVSANLCAVAIGTETDGSIACPASMNGIVGIKPTIGLVSRSGIIPISKSQDTAGPLTRTVADAAILLTVISGSDPNDDATLKNTELTLDYSQYLDINGLKGKRIGVEKTMLKRHEGIDKILKEALSQMEKCGATIVEVEFMHMTGEFGNAESDILHYEFKDGLNRYLATATTKMKSLKDIIDFNIQNEPKAMPYFKQEIFTKAEALGGLESKEYLAALVKIETYREFINKLFSEQKLDALCGPATGTSWCNDLINGDFWTGYGAYTPAAVAGYPSITVPMGFVSELPVGLSFIGKAFGESDIIAIGYAYEQASKNRKQPQFLPTLKVW
jgi:amidase